MPNQTIGGVVACQTTALGTGSVRWLSDRAGILDIFWLDEYNVEDIIVDFIFLFSLDVSPEFLDIFLLFFLHFQVA